MPGQYTDQEVARMTPDQLLEAANRGWLKPTDPADAPVRPEYAGVPVPQAPQPSGDVWARRKRGGGGDVFTCPSGQTCRIQRLTPEGLLVAGILDDISSLEDLAQSLVDKAEGVPPEKQSLSDLPDREDLARLLKVVNAIVPLALVEPKVLPDPAPGVAMEDGVLYASDIDLADRMAIMQESLKGIQNLARFRNA